MVSLLVACFFVRTVGLLVDDINLYRQDIETFLSSQLNAKVHIVDIQGRWEDWQPSISIEGLSIDGLKGQPELSFALMRGDVKFDPAESIRAFTFILMA